MSRNYYSCIITHGNLAHCLKGIAEKLVAPSVEVKSYSNLELSLEEIEKQIREDIEKQKPEKIIIFVDLAGGSSCWFLAHRLKKGNEDVTVVAGVNVPLIVSYQMYIERLEWKDLIEKIVEDGKKGIITV